MPAPERTPAALDRAARALAILGGAILLGISALVTVNVLGRWLFDAPLPGDFEMVEIGVAVAGFAFLPVCQMRGGNIIVDAFTDRSPAWLRRGLDGTWSLLYAAVAAILAWQLAAGARDTEASGTTSMVLGLPLGWGMAAGSFCLAFLALVSVAVALREFMRTDAR
jgi:TRAP-type C4-dicarboxylate transport system permease small subunit